MADKVIEIPGVGNVAFPDSMTDDQIRVAIRTKILPQSYTKTPAQIPTAEGLSPEQQQTSQKLKETLAAQGPKMSQAIEQRQPAKDEGFLRTLGLGAAEFL